jgi:hypothetical protein
MPSLMVGSCSDGAMKLWVSCSKHDPVFFFGCFVNTTPMSKVLQGASWDSVDGLRFWQRTSQSKQWPDKASNVIRVWCTMCLTLGQRSWTRYESHSFKLRYHELYESHHCKLRYDGLYEAQSCKLRVWLGDFSLEN